MELREHIDSLATGEPKPGDHPCPSPSAWGAQGAHPNPSPELCRINEDQKVALDLDPYVKKLLNARRRVVLVNNILQNAQVRGDRGVWGGPGAPPGADRRFLPCPGAAAEAEPQRGQGDREEEGDAGGRGLPGQVTK